MTVIVPTESPEYGPVPTRWRPQIEAVVAALATDDWERIARMPAVEPVSQQTATRIRDYILAYGEPLVALPATAWETSVCRWRQCDWEVEVDLWTRSGRSDMTLTCSVRNDTGNDRLSLGYIFVA